MSGVVKLFKDTILKKQVAIKIINKMKLKKLKMSKEKNMYS